MRLRVSLVSLLVCVCLLADDPAAWELYENGRAAEKAGHMAQAYLLYAEAAAMEPRNKTYSATRPGRCNRGLPWSPSRNLPRKSRPWPIWTRNSTK